MSNIVNKLWGFCHVLRHDGIDYGDYVEQITLLLFLKMAEEKGRKLHEGCNWNDLKEKFGTDLLDSYEKTLRILSKKEGILGDIFAAARNRFNKPVNLKKLMNLIDGTEWTTLDMDIKAEVYEGLLERAAAEGKKGAGQYFTPRILINSIVKVMKPDPMVSKEFTICDPACGTGYFLVASFKWLVEKNKGVLPREEVERIKKRTYLGTELVQRPRRLSLMNLYLRGIESHIHYGDSIYDSDQGKRYDMILTNPPFGTKGANQAPNRPDFMIKTSNKQLNFIQHVYTLLKSGGRAAIVIPDNCLFAKEGLKVFEYLFQDCNVHTLIRLPNGTFSPYSPGVKANVLFFTKGKPTENIWIYDARTDIHSITKKDRPLTPKHFQEFENCYGSDPNVSSEKAIRHRKDMSGKIERFKKYNIQEIKKRNYNLDISCFEKEKDEFENEEPEIILNSIKKSEEKIIIEIENILEILKYGNNNHGV